MTKEEIDNLSDIEFVPILKACLLRLQNDDDQYGNVINIELEGYNRNAIVIAYVDNDHNEPVCIDEIRKKIRINGIETIDINSTIK